MMKKDKIQISATRGGSEILNNLNLKIDNKIFDIDFNEDIIGQYNIRFVFEKIIKNPSYPNEVLGSLIGSKSFGSYDFKSESNVTLSSKDNFFNKSIDLLLDGSFYIDVKLFKDTPINYYPVLDTIPVPTNLITVYVCFSEIAIEELSPINNIQKYFDAYSHLGFFLADLDRMKAVIEKEYGDKELDLVHEFSNSDIIDKLFEEEIIMIVWGINPYTYPIYSTDKIDLIKPLLGREFEQESVFNIRKDISELSLVAGSELKNYPQFLEKEWTKIQLKGKGKKTYLKPYVLEDSDLETVLASFLIYRVDEELEESKPLINVDLLYS